MEQSKNDLLIVLAGLLLIALTGCSHKKYLKSCKEVGQVEGQAVFGECKDL